jgi:NAD(P)-dependent dehydrogenase (short-subunit alcohol dehydrogenase family)
MNKRVLVTGGAQRLGAEICRSFAQSGWHVVCHYKNSEADAQALCVSLRALGVQADAVQADLSDEAHRVALLRNAVARFGAIHCLVNNASQFEPDEADSFDAQLANAQINVNLVAPLALSAELARQSERLNLQDVAVIHILDQKVFNPNPDYFSYTVSKLALERAIQVQAQALAPRIRVCGIAPGLLYPSGPQTAENFAKTASHNLLQRPIDPAWVAQTCVFLAQNPCVTGTTLCVDNGQHLVPLARDVMFMVE